MSDPQAGECPPRSRWKSWRGRLLVGAISISRIRHHAIRCRMNHGMQSWPTHAPPDSHRCRSSNVASRKSPDHVLRVECGALLSHRRNSEGGCSQVLWAKCCLEGCRQRLLDQTCTNRTDRPRKSDAGRNSAASNSPQYSRRDRIRSMTHLEN